MTLRSSADVAFLLIGGRNVLGRVTQLNDTEEAIVEEITALGDNTDRWAAVGTKTWTITQQGFYDGATAGYNEALAQTHPQVLMYGLTSNDAGSEFVGGVGVRTTFARTAAQGQLHRATGTYRSSTGFYKGVLLAPLSTRTTEGPASLAAVDLGAAFANQETGRLRAFLGVTALSLDGATGLQVKVRQSDAEAGTYEDVVTFATVTTAPASESVLVVAGASPNDIERYMQVQWEFLGTPSGNQSATFVVGVARQLT